MMGRILEILGIVVALGYLLVPIMRGVTRWRAVPDTTPPSAPTGITITQLQTSATPLPVSPTNVRVAHAQ